jgi:hypothetical protein
MGNSLRCALLEINRNVYENNSLAAANSARHL